MSRIRMRAFTLVELLVVIAIIAILAGLILPALQRSRRAARETNCMGQMKEFGNAIEMYTAGEEGKYPYWLSSMLDNEMGGSQLSYVCPLDESKGAEGARPDWIAGDQYAETNDIPIDTFTTVDKTAFPATSSNPRVTEDARNDKLELCSYMYEFNREPCSWYTGGYGSLTSPDATWEECKLYEATGQTEDDSGVKVNRSRIPIIRCFHHIEDLGTHTLSDTSDAHQHIMNLRMSYAVNKSPPKKWWIEN